MSYSLKTTPVWVALPGYRILPPEAARYDGAAAAYDLFRTDVGTLTGNGL